MQGQGLERRRHTCSAPGRNTKKSGYKFWQHDTALGHVLVLSMRYDTATAEERMPVEFHNILSLDTFPTVVFAVSHFLQVMVVFFVFLIFFFSSFLSSKCLPHPLRGGTSVFQFFFSFDLFSLFSFSFFSFFVILYLFRKMCMSCLSYQVRII